MPLPLLASYVHLFPLLFIHFAHGQFANEFVGHECELDGLPAVRNPCYAVLGVFVQVAHYIPHLAN